MEAQRLDALAKGEQELTTQSYESSSLWEAQARASEGEKMQLHVENLTLKQNNFAANLTASSSSAEAEQTANEAKTLLASLVEANELLNAQVQQLAADNENLKSSVVALTKSLNESEQTLKREKGSHYKEEDDVATQLSSSRKQLEETQKRAL